MRNRFLGRGDADRLANSILAVAASGLRRTKIAMMADAMMPVSSVPMNPAIACPIGVAVNAAARTASSISAGRLSLRLQDLPLIGLELCEVVGKATVVKSSEEQMTMTPATTAMSVPATICPR